MENIVLDWISISLIFAAGMIVGALLCYLLKFGSKQSRQLQKDLQSSQEELNRYKEEVTDHFEETAELFSELTQKYQQVYQHVAKSSQKLCDDQSIHQRLSNSPSSTNEATSKDEEAKDDSLISNPLLSTMAAAQANIEEIDSDSTSDTKSKVSLKEPTEEDFNSDYNMPRDYALVSDKHKQGGTLSEGFGIAKDKRDSCLDETPNKEAQS